RLVEKAVEETNLLQIAALWVEGAKIPWEKLHDKNRVGVISLPTYPFIKRDCREALFPEESLQKKYKEKAKKENSPDMFHGKEENKAVPLYNHLAREHSPEFQEEYLTFVPFPEKISGFSITKIATRPEDCPDEIALIKAKQIEMREVLFLDIDFSKVNMVLDFGCGHGTDVIQIADNFSHIQTHGFTISPVQAQLGGRRIKDKNLESRAFIFNKDSSKDKFPGKYDLVIGVEVSCHISDKTGLFKNIESALKGGGHLLMADFIGNLRGDITDPGAAVHISTRQAWIDILSDHNLYLYELIDVSKEIANSQYDPEFEQNTKDLPRVVRDSFQNWTNNSIAMEKGFVSYCLFKIKKNTDLDQNDLRAHNASTISGPILYAHALERMQRLEKPFYPGPVKSPRQDSVRMFSDEGQILKDVTTIFATILGLAKQEVENSQTLQELGITSLMAVELLERVNEKFGLTLPTGVLIECSSLESFADLVWAKVKELPNELPEPDAKKSLVSGYGKHPNQKIKQGAGENDIAIIGFSSRCAGALEQDQLWEVVSQGRNCIKEIKNESWREFITSNSKESYPFQYGAMEGIEEFDPLFFNISPKEAASMDVTQRILLEESYKALENSGYAPGSLKNKPCGTYIGVMGVAPGKEGFSHLSMLGSETSILASRIAYFLDIKGPALAVNTSCSSSLVAMDLACKALKQGEICLAISGGITVYTGPEPFVYMRNADMLSPTGVCSPFDQKADGIVVGDGAGIVILKRLEDAVKDHDNIHGIIRGIGTNQDGQTSGITVPSLSSQSRLISSVYEKAGINVEDIQYVEAHGTATKLGDPVEIHAINKSFGQFTQKTGFCAIGSLKANIGHTTAAAGVLGLIKVLLCLKYQKLPPSIHFTRNNELIQFDKSPVYVNTALKDWPLNAAGSRLAALSAFGFSGTNGHMLIEEYIAGNDRKAKKQSPVPIILSSKHSNGLQKAAINLLNHINIHSIDNFFALADISYTLQVGRDAMEERLGFVTDSIEDLTKKLTGFISDTGAQAGFFRGRIGEKNETLEALSGENILEKTLNEWIREKKLSKLLHFWTKGVTVDWEGLFGHVKPYRIGLPAYSFAKEIYPIPGLEDDSKLQKEGFQNRDKNLVDEVKTLILKPVWTEKPAVTDPAVTDPAVTDNDAMNYSSRMVMLCRPGRVLPKKTKVKISGMSCMALSSCETSLEKQYLEICVQVFDTIKKMSQPGHQGHILLQIVVCSKGKDQVFTGLSGLVKTACLENPNILGQLIQVDPRENSRTLAAKLIENSQSPLDTDVSYLEGKRKVLSWKEAGAVQKQPHSDSRAINDLPWKENGVYLITGGAGGLGKIFARKITQQVKGVRLILTGRSRLNPEQKAWIGQLVSSGAMVEYCRVDVTRKKDLFKLVQSIKDRFGSLNGILHSAGIICDNFIPKKSAHEFIRVLAPKVTGTA
ncbi:MAG: SDR family NAD(P)-dependent oxidoreductase, partial [Desulfobacteraceae bacterium]|nr:SDR family NAD(P)-dependent oxidoreductase [Desulfobacteraceae bacterium]